MNEKICRLKQEKDVVILAHYYVDGAVQEIADFVGDSYALAKLAAEKNGRERFRYFFVYMHDIWRTGHWKIYGEDLKRDYHTYCKNKIHFAVPILFSAVCRIGGLL